MQIFRKLKDVLSNAKQSVLALALAMFVGLSALPAPAHAAGLADLTAAVSFSDVLTAIPAVGALLAAVYVLRKGAKFILGFIK